MGTVVETQASQLWLVVARGNDKNIPALALGTAEASLFPEIKTGGNGEPSRKSNVEQLVSELRCDPAPTRQVSISQSRARSPPAELAAELATVLQSLCSPSPYFILRIQLDFPVTTSNGRAPRMGNPENGKSSNLDSRRNPRSTI